MQKESPLGLERISNYLVNVNYRLY